MSPTSKRTPPNRVFEDYIFTRFVDQSAGLTNVPDKKFTQVPGSGSYTYRNDTFGAGASGTDDADSNIIPIGFDFLFDGTVFKRFIVNTNGYMVLLDPTKDAFHVSEINHITGSEGAGSKSNEGIKVDTGFDSNVVLLAPWYDDISNSLSAAPSTFAGTGFYDVNRRNRIATGKEMPDAFINNVSYGIRYYNDNSSKFGRRLIVRWSSLTAATAPTSLLQFEVVLYENGTIEYRYAPRRNLLFYKIPDALLPYFTESATVGIFVSGSNRFRDFSAGLGYRDDVRSKYIYGGYNYNANYTDVSASYTVSLQSSLHWPGQVNAGCVMRFSPPVSRRKILPNNELVRKGSQKISSFGTFDDRRSPTYLSQSNIVVNYPTTLPRFFGDGDAGTFERQNLFTGDFLVTSSIVKSAIEQHIELDYGQNDRVNAFDESGRFEQDQLTVTSFFSTGSNTTYAADGFSQSLKSKSQIALKLLVNNSASMPGCTSSIYYYNSSTKAWNVPSNSTYQLFENVDFNDPAATPDYTHVPYNNPHDDWTDPYMYGQYGMLIEDVKGFGPIGNIVGSGSTTFSVPSGQQTDTMIGSSASYAASSLIDAIGKSYPKGIRNNEEYAPTTSEVFTLPIETPFVVEKAVIELPLAFGPGWFSDITECFLPGSSSAYVDTAFDFSGPTLTVALHRHVKLSGNKSRRELILTGTITHVNDNISSVRIENYPPYNSDYQIRPVGFLSYANPPSAVVQPNASNQFTGSVKIYAEAMSTAGTVLRFVRKFNSSSFNQNRTSSIDLLTNTSTLNLVNNNSYPSQSVNFAYNSPLGRGGTGLQMSGRSTLGNELATLQSFSDQTASSVKNPFNVGTLNTQQSAILNGAGQFTAYAVAAIPMISYATSPYMVMPGDKFVLSISKMRPKVYMPFTGSGAPISSPSLLFSGSASHDVTLTTGEINITLYGSMVREGKEFHG